ncbi:MAG: glucosyl-3-phosphoglycerate synthase [Actinobacteria bacterium]|nr:glucosyl-3-phosphoglycerate synthase [Actinomycetota bacterium]
MTDPHRWFAARTFGAAGLPDGRALAARKTGTIAVALPALDEAETIGAICAAVPRDLVDEIVVLDGGSADGTQEAAKSHARVVDVRALLPEFPPVRGKGDGMWRGLSVIDADIVVFIDADIRNFAPHFVTRLVAPLLLDESIAFVKGFYRRPLVHGDTVVPDGGGRVTELAARPLLNAFFPELAGVLQPLGGEYAARRSLLERLPFFSGYSVEVGLLIDLLSHDGLDVLAQVDLGERVHRNRPLVELTPMASAIARTILARAERGGRLVAAQDYPEMPLLVPRGSTLESADVAELERPPLVEVCARKRG